MKDYSGSSKLLQHVKDYSAGSIEHIPIPGETQRRSSGKLKKTLPSNESRFANYLSGSFQPARSLSRNPNTRRNKIIILLVFILLILFWTLFYFLY